MECALKARDTGSKLDWENLRFFNAVATTGSLSRAARMLHTDHSTVRRRVEILEQQIGAQLFYRHARGYDLTSTGEKIVQWVARMSAGAEGLDGMLRGRVPAPLSFIRIRATPVLGEVLLRPSVHKLPDRLPEVCAEILYDEDDAGAPKRPGELSLRCSYPTSPMVDVLHLGSMEFGLFCSSGYLKGRIIPTRKQELSDHAFIDWTEDICISAIYRDLEQSQVHRRTVLIAASLEMLLTAVTRGVGIGLLPLQIGSQEDLQLVRLLPLYSIGWIDAKLVCPTDWRTSWAMRSVVEFIQQCASDLRQSNQHSPSAANEQSEGGAT